MALALVGCWLIVVPQDAMKQTARGLAGYMAFLSNVDDNQYHYFLSCRVQVWLLR